MLASLRNLLWPKQRRQPAAEMGTFSRLPDDVLTTRVAGYFSRGTEEYLSLRALCASGRDVGEAAQEIEHILDERDPRGYLVLHY